MSQPGEPARSPSPAEAQTTAPPVRASRSTSLKSQTSSSLSPVFYSSAPSSVSEGPARNFTQNPPVPHVSTLINQIAPSPDQDQKAYYGSVNVFSQETGKTWVDESNADWWRMHGNILVYLRRAGGYPISLGGAIGAKTLPGDDPYDALDKAIEHCQSQERRLRVGLEQKKKTERTQKLKTRRRKKEERASQARRCL